MGHVDAIGRHVERPAEARVEQRHVIALEIVVGVRLPVAGEAAFESPDVTERLEAELLAFCSERGDRLVEQRRVVAEVDEHEVAPPGDRDRREGPVVRAQIGLVAEITGGLELAVPVEGPAVIPAHQVAGSPRPGHSITPARCGQTLWNPRSEPSRSTMTNTGLPATSSATYWPGRSSDAAGANITHSSRQTQRRSAVEGCGIAVPRGRKCSRRRRRRYCP